MNLAELLKFVPLIIGLFLAYHLIFRQSLPSKKLGEMATYFIGIIIVLLVVGWLIESFLAGWAADLLRSGTSSPEWQEFITESESVVDDAFTGTSSNLQPTPTAQATPVPIMVVTATPFPGQTILNTPNTSGGALRQYTVVSGDTLTGIAQRFGVSLESVVMANGIGNPNSLSVGQVLIIPSQ